MLQVGHAVKKAVFNRTIQEYKCQSVTITKITRKFIFCGYDKFLKDTGELVGCGEVHKTHLILDEAEYAGRKSKNELIRQITANLSKLSHDQLLEINEIITSA